jgi:hypothetical protein
MLKYLELFCTGFEVLRVVWIHNAVWVRTQYSLVLVFKRFGGAFWACLHMLTETIVPTSQITSQIIYEGLRGPTTQKTRIINLYVSCFRCIVALFIAR